MIQYLLTGLAGIVIGIVAVRIWMMRDVSPGGTGSPVLGEPVGNGMRVGQWRLSMIILATAALIAAVSIAIVLVRGRDTFSGTAPAASSAIASFGTTSSASGLDDVDVMIDRLEKRLETTPDDGEGFRMLGWSYVNTGKPEKALPAYERALKLLPSRADVHAGYGEALAGIGGGTVTKDAKAAFDKAIALDPKEPRARYFEALYRAQNGDRQGALEDWIALANEGPADASWQGDLHKRIDETAKALGKDVSAQLKAAPIIALQSKAKAPELDASTVAAASALPDTERQAMIEKMVEGLAQKLNANPKDPDGWIRLLRSRMVLNQRDRAASDLTTARHALAGSSADLDQINAAARTLGVPGS